MDIREVLQRAVAQSASDILISAGLPVAYKKNGFFERQGERLHAADAAALTQSLYDLAGRDSAPFLQSGDDDFSFALPGLSRFRVNALRQRGTQALVIRVVSFALPDRKALHIPDAVMRFAACTRGLVLITGPAGSGKTTTLACIVDAINSTRCANVITVEDPIEYLHSHKKSIVMQRELAVDTVSYAAALRGALRQAPDVILLGEMRDNETMRAAMTAAETGHLVISTLHTIGAVHTIDRIIDSFEPRQQQQIRTQLALVLEGVASQQLLPSQDGGLRPAFEVMTVNSAIRTMIRESRTHQMENEIFSAAAEGMCTMDQSICELARAGAIAAETALRYSIRPDWVKKRLSAPAGLG